MNKRARFTAESAQSTFTSLKGLMAPVEDAAETAEIQVVEVELGRIRPNPDQPRRSSSAGLKKSSLEELAENIREHGLLQPILVKDTGRFYQIIAGERRFRACQLLGMERVPVRVVEPRDDQDELRIALAENLQRKNLDALEEARAFSTLIHRFGLSYRDLAKLSGRSLAHVHGRLQLLEYDDVRAAVEARKIGIADAIQLARVPDEASRKELLMAAQDGSLRGSALHRRVQVFLGEIDPEAAEEPQELQALPQTVAPELTLDGAVGLVQGLPEELSEEDCEKVRTLAALAAERLGMRLAEEPQAEAPPEAQETEPAEEPVPMPASLTPAPLTPETRRIISRVKDHRNSRGYTVVNLIRVYWKSVERRGYAFSPGEWSVVPAGESGHGVRCEYRVDDEPHVMEWLHAPDGMVTPTNEDARIDSG